MRADMQFFEVTKAQRQLADIGRAMQDYSEDYGKHHGLAHLTDAGLRILNELSQVGGMLVRYGVTFGTTINDFTEADRALIVGFMKKTLEIK